MVFCFAEYEKGEYIGISCFQSMDAAKEYSKEGSDSNGPVLLELVGWFIEEFKAVK